MPNKPTHSDSPTMAGPGRPTLASRASALLVTLLLLTIVTTIVVLMFQAVTIDRRLASDFQKGVQARAISQFALDDALQTLQSALNNLDDPFGATSAATNFWAVAPGRLDLFSLASGNSRPLRTSTIALHSGYDTSQELVDLNFTNASGSRAIWPGGQEMPVNWKPVLKNPSSAASAANPAVGRYAFWVDDESSKVNINTADGTELYTTNSYGLGTPSSVRLGTILTNLSTNQIKAIAAAAITNQFSDISEVGRLDTNYLAAVRSNAFFLTEYSRSPEFNIFNEPRFYLAMVWAGNRASNGTGSGTMGTPTNYVANSLARRLNLDYRHTSFIQYGPPLGNSSFPARFLYPAPRQLTNTNRASFWPYIPTISCDDVPTKVDSGYIASTAKISNALGTQSNNIFSINYNSRERFNAAFGLAQYLVGTNANNQTISWPFSQANFSSKYSTRQIDSIVVQTLDMAQMPIFGLQQRAPLFAPYGILGSQPVIGLGNGPKLMELMYRFTFYPEYDASMNLTGGSLRPELWAKGYTPCHYLNPITPGMVTSCPEQLNGMTYIGNMAAGSFFQWADYPRLGMNNRASNWSSTPGIYYPANPALQGYPGGATFYTNASVVNPNLSTNTSNPYGSWWGDSLLQAVDQNGDSAGVDFMQNPRDRADPDPRASRYRRPVGGTNYGTGLGNSTSPRGFAWHINNDYAELIPGVAYVAPANQQVAGLYSTYNNVGSIRTLPTRDYLTNGIPKLTSITMQGGWTYRMSFFGHRGIYQAIPLASLAGTLSGNTTALISTNLPPSSAVIPFPAGVTINATTPTRCVSFSVADPFVNAMPGNWSNNVSTGMTMPANTLGITTTLNQNTPNRTHQFRSTTNHNTRSVDMASMWAPIANTSLPANLTKIPETTNNIPNSLSFPSVGTLQYIRTKMMPPDDDGNDDRGQPFRCLSFAGTTNTTQIGIPDWALLDLLTVPQAVYDTTGRPGVGTITNVINLTYGGATTGKLNPNGSALFPWVTNSPTYIRPQPLTAVFTDLRYNLDGSTNFTALTTNLASTLASNVATYIAANGPLSMAGQICDIPAINAYGAATVNPTRNDIVSQSIGLLETRSSVFSVWVAAQSFTKKPGNTGYGSFETGDNVQAEKRYRFTVERYLDLGVDGVPGNANSPGPDNVVGTLDDNVDAVYNPPNPKYKYRIINAQEIL